MDRSGEGVPTAEQICAKLSQYFGADYDVSSNNSDVFTIKSRFRPCVYVESEDIMIVNSIVGDFGLAVERWRLVAANGQVGLYCVLSKRDSVANHYDLMAHTRWAVSDQVAV